MLNEIAIGFLSGIIFTLTALVTLAIKKFQRPMVVITNIFLIVLVAVIVFWKQISSFNLITADIPLNYQIAVVGTLIFCALGCCYMQFYALIEMSITFRMLRHLKEAKEYTMSVEDMNGVYPFSEIIERKLDDGVALGLFDKVDVSGERGYINGSKGALTATVLNWFRKILKMETVG